MNTPLISVIVPIYNVEKYLAKCIDSIVAQSYTNLEIILVDDGSPDSCGQICDEYAQCDVRIKVIHQQNGGVVNARNTAISIASGDFLSFVDADDWLEESFYEKMLKEAIEGKHQIVFCDWNVIRMGGIKETNSVFFSSNPKIVLRRNLSVGNSMDCALWNKLIQKNFYDECNIITDQNCTMMEDLFISIQLLYNANNIGYVHESLYNYVSRIDSATGNKEKNPLLMSAPNIYHVYKFLLDKNILKEYQSTFFNLVMLVKFSILNNRGLKSAREFIPHAHKSISSYPINNKFLRTFYWICFNAGYLGGFAMKIYYKLVKDKKNKQ